MKVHTVSSKGQITLPVSLRRRFGIDLHDRVIIDATEEGIRIRPAGDIFGLAGFLGSARPQAEEREAMLGAVADHVEGRDPDKAES